MILFLEYSINGMRGGEIYFAHFFNFISSHFSDVVPKTLLRHPPEIQNIFKNMFHHLALVKKLKPELIVVDVSSGLRNILAVRWMKKNKKKTLIIIQEQRQNYRCNLPVFKWVIRQCEKYLVTQADILLVNSDYTLRQARRLGLSSSAFQVKAYPGLENVSVSHLPVKSNRKKKNDPFNLLMVGACIERKGIFYLVEALIKLKDLPIHLNIAGDYSLKSPYFKKIEKLIHRYSLQNNITFHGHVGKNQLIELYQESSIYVQPSLMEGYGMALVEAMANGLPIIASNTGAIPEIIKKGINGLLVESHDSDGLAQAIRKFYSHPALRENMQKTNLCDSQQLKTWQDFSFVLEKEMIPAIEKSTGIQSVKNINEPPVLSCEKK